MLELLMLFNQNAFYFTASLIFAYAALTGRQTSIADRAFTSEPSTPDTWDEK
ncbi:hypothetical protein BT63DRAFT_420133 [Microthyrium microscopicum]|uniref:Uncharacterized protein n=1 Tax=Microthyrium microscopicum TaxID=703497 RepID=A0A6A6UV83_9PEZI|nr:hypothetical protein BT63DRAFT_420133 [Microthyrium microscopicum]